MALKKYVKSHPRLQLSGTGIEEEASKEYFIITNTTQTKSN
jgi:hypothetical protein